MLGQFKIIGDRCYVQINNQGTLEKLPKMPWYYVFYFAFKNAFKGGVSIDEIREACNKNSEENKKCEQCGFSSKDKRYVWIIVKFNKKKKYLCDSDCLKRYAQEYEERC